MNPYNIESPMYFVKINFSRILAEDTYLYYDNLEWLTDKYFLISDNVIQAWILDDVADFHPSEKGDDSKHCGLTIWGVHTSKCVWI